MASSALGLWICDARQACGQDIGEASGYYDAGDGVPVDAADQHCYNFFTVFLSPV